MFSAWSLRLPTGEWGLRDYGEPGQGGLEPTPEAHIEWIVGVLRELRRVLRDDGVVWLNYGDCYWNGGAEKRDGGKTKLLAAKGRRLSAKSTAHNLKPKDLVGMPWRVALEDFREKGGQILRLGDGPNEISEPEHRED